MKISAPNLYQRAGNWVCLLSDDSVIDFPSTGEEDTMRAVIYMTPDGVMHSTSRGRWEEQFNQMPYYDGDEDSVLQMIRRTNPGDSSLDFLSAMESWHESEMGITGHMLELAVAATALQCSPAAVVNGLNRGQDARVRISTEDLQNIVQTYDVERVPEPHAFTFIIRKVR